ncbi:hemoglobin beta embryonic-3 [Danio rerio]|uniref:Hemoglobin beta embryonic-3 n=1 Tax=Danio rerio TaxID=7955 RepID=Q5BLF6_DANRE|nr:hemoglobin beta embryonic-3 [Danio rerio]XP_056325466.1 hemoglobin beta embryonic-3 [Danio aesculapii]AAH90459.1 Hemoglobin beta embryonic-3 [Danio rerio]|eukprot:NP_001015058.1 hemoglobin beta embryonic-3 [Danio rerio]
MVVWTAEERAAIQNIFAKLDFESVGLETLTRCLVVYPWTQRYFGGFGNLYNTEAIMANPKVKAHGVVVLKGLEKALNNMDNIKSTYASLSELHSEKLQVDPGNFRLLADCLTVVIATRMRSEFTPDIQAAWQKFLSVVVSALRRQYL